MTRAKDMALLGDSASDLKTKKAEGIVTSSTTNVIGINHMTDAVKVTESEGISSNDNDTTIPTSAAIIDHLTSFAPNATLALKAPILTPVFQGKVTLDTQGVEFSDGTSLTTAPSSGGVTTGKAIAMAIVFG